MSVAQFIAFFESNGLRLTEEQVLTLAADIPPESSPPGWGWTYEVRLLPSTCNRGTMLARCFLTPGPLSSNFTVHLPASSYLPPPPLPSDLAPY